MKIIHPEVVADLKNILLSLIFSRVSFLHFSFHFLYFLYKFLYKITSHVGVLSSFLTLCSFLYFLKKQFQHCLSILYFILVKTPPFWCHVHCSAQTIPFCLPHNLRELAGANKQSLMKECRVFNSKKWSSWYTAINNNLRGPSTKQALLRVSHGRAAPSVTARLIRPFCLQKQVHGQPASNPVALTSTPMKVAPGVVFVQPGVLL